MKTLLQLAAALANGTTSARALVQQSLERIANPAGEGARAFITVDHLGALESADQHDAARKAGRSILPFAGIPFAVKDLFDVAGEVTTAGSLVLQGSAPALHDSVAVARLRAQGFIPIGRSNMTEFAYSGVGLNPHYGTPLSVYDRANRRIPGGSSSGTAVAVADGMVPCGLGTDTGGSCRIPSAFNGIVGFKPSAASVNKTGVYPLSTSFDSIGPHASSVACCATLHGILAGRVAAVSLPSRPLRLGVLQDVVADGLDGAVASDFAQVVNELTHSGVEVVPFHFSPLGRLPEFLVNGGIVAAEAWAHHGALIAAHEAHYDPRVSSRIRFGERISLEDITRWQKGRAEMIAAFATAAAGFDAIICPTVAIIPPMIAELAGEDDYRRINGLCLRNTYVFNLLDACAISIPMQRAGAAPTGLMLARANGGDFELLAVAERVEQILNSRESSANH